MQKINDGKTNQQRVIEKKKSEGYALKQFWLSKENDILLGKLCIEYSKTRSELIGHLLNLCAKGGEE